jgi:hypothetical protein
MAQNWMETLVTAQADGTALTAAARASALPAAAIFTLRPNFFDSIGKMIRIWASGRISVVVTTPGTARFDVNFLDSAAANAIVFDSQAIALDPVASTNVHFELDIVLTCRAIGATGNLFQFGTFKSQIIAGQPATPPKGVLTALLPWNTAPAVGANFNTTLAQTVDLRFTQTVATGSMTLHQYAMMAVLV